MANATRIKIYYILDNRKQNNSHVTAVLPLSWCNGKRRRRDGGMMKSVRAWNSRGDVKRIGVLLHIWLCWKVSEASEPVKVHFLYKALGSQEQQVDRFLGWSSQPLTMAGLGGPTVLVPTICTYRAYLSSPETDPFSGNYEAVLEPYIIDLMNTDAALTPSIVSQQIYAAS